MAMADDDGDRRYDDERAETGSPWDAGEHAEDGSGIEARWHGARGHRTKDTLFHAMTDWYWNAPLTAAPGEPGAQALTSARLRPFALAR